MRASDLSSGPEHAPGVTAMELLVTLAIIAILVAAGAPAFGHYLSEQRMKAAVATFHSDLVLARSAAISRNARMVTCPADDAGQCSAGSDWQSGWVVFLDANDDRERQVDEPVLRRSKPGAGILITTSAHRNRLRFFPNGTAPGSNAGIDFCDHRGAASGRRITISASGRLRRLAPEEAGLTDCGS